MIDKATREKIIDLRRQGIPVFDIARECGVGKSTVYAITSYMQPHMIQKPKPKEYTPGGKRSRQKERIPPVGEVIPFADKCTDYGIKLLTCAVLVRAEKDYANAVKRTARIQSRLDKTTDLKKRAELTELKDRAEADIRTLRKWFRGKWCMFLCDAVGYDNERLLNAIDRMLSRGEQKQARAIHRRKG